MFLTNKNFFFQFVTKTVYVCLVLKIKIQWNIPEESFSHGKQISHFVTNLSVGPSQQYVNASQMDLSS